MATERLSSKFGLASDASSFTDVFINLFLLWLASIGAAVILYLLVQSLISLYRAKVRSSYDLKRRYGQGWGVVTGATDGIGKAAAWQLAKRGLNVLLISRTPSKLDETQKELSVRFPAVQIKTLQVDFGVFDEALQGLVAKNLAGLEGGVAILINNVGVSYDFPMLFHELSEARVADMIKLNIDSTTYMTRIVLNLMRERQGGSRRGAIINIGSAAGSTSNPLLTQYSAAKAYVQRFSEGLATEYGPLGIDIQVHVPFFIVSKLSKYKKPSFLVPSAEAYAKLICDRIGYEVVCNPYLPHALCSFVLELLPTGPRESYTRSMHMGIRARGMKKLAEKGEGKKLS